MNSKTMLENEEYIKDAIGNGVDGEAVSATLEDVVNKADMMGKTPEQLKETVDTIVEMKTTPQSNVSEEYLSDVVKNNSDKLKAAINEGIKPEEVAQELINTTQNIKDKKDKKHLNFIVKLLSKMKKKELKLTMDKQNTKGYQKVYQKID